MKECGRACDKSSRLVRDELHRFELETTLQTRPTQLPRHGAEFDAASRLYKDADLADLGKIGGFTDVSVQRPELEPYARKAGPSEGVVVHFQGSSFGELLSERKQRKVRRTSGRA